MNISIKPGEHFYSFTTLTPANFGAAYGHTSIDSPTQVDAQHFLPYIPDSAIKGVIGSYLEMRGETDKREKYFGKGDDVNVTDPKKIRFGKASKVVFGNGNLVLFPAKFPGGPTVHIVVLHQLLSLLVNEPAINLDEPAKEFISTFLQKDVSRSVFPINGVFSITGAESLRPFEYTPEMGVFDQVGKLLKHFIGPNGLTGSPVLIAGPETSAFLWKKAAETRTLIKMNKRQVAEEQSLRTIQLIPPGSIFISLISNLDDQPLDLSVSGPCQFGAWENLGFGWFQIEAVEPPPEEETEEFPESSLTVESLEDQTMMMTTAYRAIADFPGPDPARRKVKTAISQFGSRLKSQGIEATLAFELAKAKPFRKKYSHEVYAHRWLLYQLLSLSSPPPTEDGDYGELQKDEEAAWFANPFSAVRILTIEQRWQWLRKFSELGLDEQTRR